MIKKKALLIIFLYTNFLSLNAQNKKTEITALENNTNSESTNKTTKAIEIDAIATDEFVLCRETLNMVLYDNCANKFKLISPQNKKKYTIQSISTAEECIIEIEKDSINKGLFIFTTQKSNAKTGRVGVFDKKNKLVQEFSFNILKVPPVKIIESNTNLPLDQLAKQGINVNKNSSTMILKAISADDFIINYPLDSRCIIKNAELHLVNGRKNIKSIHANNVIDLKSLFEIVNNDTTNAGYRLIIEVTNVKRLNYKGQLTNTSNSPLIYSIPLYKD